MREGHSAAALTGSLRLELPESTLKRLSTGETGCPQAVVGRCRQIRTQPAHATVKAGDVAGSIRSKRVIEVLSRLVSVHGAPLFMRSDNGPEFVSHAILEWIAQTGIGTALSDPGKPWQNGADKSFNGKLRDECLSLERFRSREEAAVIIEAWRRDYNTVRPHSSLKDLTPQEFKQQHHVTPTRAVL